jgi:hypothetical protein
MALGSDPAKCLKRNENGRCPPVGPAHDIASNYPTTGVSCEFLLSIISWTLWFFIFKNAVKRQSRPPGSLHQLIVK